MVGSCVLFSGMLIASSGCDGDEINCIRNIECVEQCGGSVVQNGCDPCPAGTVDKLTCEQGGGGSGGAGSGPATTFEECQENIGIALTCGDAGVELVAFVPGVTCTGMSSFTESERVIFETDLDINVVGIRIEDVPPTSLSASITFTAPMPVALDALPQQLDWPGNFKPNAGAAAITFTEHRPATTTFEIDKPPIDAIGQENNRGTFTMSGGEVDRMEDGSEVTVATPDADVRGCFRLYGDVQPM